MKPDGCVEHRYAAAEHEVFIWRQVAGAHPDERARVDAQGGRRWRGQHDLARPRQQRARQLETRVLLAEDEHPLPGVRLDGLDLAVVIGKLDPRRVGNVRLGDTDGQDERPAAVLAVARFDDKGRAPGVLLDARPGPRAAVADRDRGTLGERRQVRLHLRARQEVGRPVHEHRLQGAGRGLLGQQAVPVVALVRARAALDGGVRLRPRQEPLEMRPTPKHPAGRRILRDDRVVDALRAQGVRQLQPAGAAADDDDRVFAGRERPAGDPTRSGQLRNRWALWRRRVWACSIR